MWRIIVLAVLLGWLSVGGVVQTWADEAGTVAAARWSPSVMRVGV